MNTLRSKDITHNLDILNLCTGCGCCKNVCPTSAITMTENHDGFLEPQVDYGKCTDCGLCSVRCPALHPVYKNVDVPECLAVCAQDKIRFVSSSGGVFTLASHYILSKNGYIVGAAFSADFRLHHIVVNNKKDLAQMRGSKYLQSNTSTIYQEIKNLLQKGKYVLFTGMPCQVAGLYSFLNKDYDTLFTIDIFCHGITSYKVFSKYLHDVFPDKKLEKIYFKAKKTWGWHAGINAYFTDGSKYSEPLGRDPYYVAYLSSISKNRTCATCPFNKLPRQGDISIGDFWGINNYDKNLNDGKGTSCVLVNNEKGHHLVNSFKDVKINASVPIDVAIKGNGIITHPYKKYVRRDDFFAELDNTNFIALIRRYKNDKLSSPVVLRNFDLSNGYNDIFNNKINKSNGTVKEIIFRGCNNDIFIADAVNKLGNLTIDITCGTKIKIGSHTSFHGALKINVNGFYGSAQVLIGDSVQFSSGLFFMFNSVNDTLVKIGDRCTFGEDLHIYANIGKKIIFGNDCMASRHIDFRAGDGHTIFDIDSAAPANAYKNDGYISKNKVVLGDHVWIGEKALVLCGTDLGEGSVIGANSVVTHEFPNNVIVAGNPAKLVKKNSAWSREMGTLSIDKCGGFVNRTTECKPRISGMNVLVVGGTRFSGVQLVKELLKWGNTVTIATRGTHADSFGDSVKRIRMDVTKPESVAMALADKKYDVLFTTLLTALII